MSQENAIALIQDGGIVWATSTDVAERLEKPHRDVLAKIRSLDCDPEYHRRNFSQMSSPDSYGRPQPYYRMTRDGFTFLMSRFTGALAASWMVKFIEAFNVLERRELDRIDANNAAIEELRRENIEMYRLITTNTKGVFGAVTELADKHAKVEQRLGSVEAVVIDIKTKLEVVDARTTKSKRKEISEETKSKHRRVLEERQNRCPGCEKEIDPAQFDHFFDNQRNNFEHSWPLCKSCHDDLTHDKNTRSKYERRFHAYQEFAAAVLEADAEELRRITPEQFALSLPE